VTFVIGNEPKVHASILANGATISSSIANEFAEAKDAMHSSALTALGLILFVITFFVLAAARLMLMRMNRRSGA
jgi:phosphate transport system permease protein